MEKVRASAGQQVWESQSMWSQAADAAKRTIARARMAGLLLGIAAAGLSTAGVQAMTWNAALGRSLVFLGAASAGLAPLAAARSGPTSLQNWTRLRSVSEALKSELYMYLACVGVYRTADAARALLDRADRIVMDAADLTYLTTAFIPVARPIPAVSDVDSYATVRLAGQIHDYYRPRADLMRRRTILMRRIEFTLAAAAATLGAAGAAFGAERASAWVPTLTTMVAAVTAHAAASRYAYQEIEFSRTAAELDSLLARYKTECESEAEADDAFVGNCEDVISAQNEGWMAKWSAA
ncbi:DUF4231 domain-containing protein [Actinomadura formosensis]|uniref:DUF4231 domain-containing protein n=1 Tax=Actinomadura formosensis TaxID=60706 RepID=UPI00082A3F3C|nr:DUF4231 domain-containing protein [Actinomadura formosensis]